MRKTERKSEKKEGPGAQKGMKVAMHFIFPMICGFGWLQSAKAAGGQSSRQMRDEKLRIVVTRSRFWKQNCIKQLSPGALLEVAIPKKSTHVHAVCTKSVGFGPLLEDGMLKKCTLCAAKHISKLKENTPCWDHFGQLRCRKSAHRCGSKHISK